MPSLPAMCPPGEKTPSSSFTYSCRCITMRRENEDEQDNEMFEWIEDPETDMVVHAGDAHAHEECATIFVVPWASFIEDVLKGYPGGSGEDEMWRQLKRDLVGQHTRIDGVHINELTTCVQHRLNPLIAMCCTQAALAMPWMYLHSRRPFCDMHPRMPTPDADTQMRCRVDVDTTRGTVSLARRFDYVDDNTVATVWLHVQVQPLTPWVPVIVSIRQSDV